MVDTNRENGRGGSVAADRSGTTIIKGDVYGKIEEALKTAERFRSGGQTAHFSKAELVEGALCKAFELVAALDDVTWDEKTREIRFATVPPLTIRIGLDGVNGLVGATVALAFPKPPVARGNPEEWGANVRRFLAECERFNFLRENATASPKAWKKSGAEDAPTLEQAVVNDAETVSQAIYKAFRATKNLVEIVQVQEKHPVGIRTPEDFKKISK